MRKILMLTSIISAYGCSSKILETSSIPDTTVSKLGTVYYLPKALIPISITVQERSKSASSVSGNAAPLTSTSQTITNNVTVNAAQAPTAKDEAAPGIEPSLQFIVTVKGNQIIPDTSKAYFLQYFPENSSDDEVSISVNSNQLLQTSSAKSTDDSGKAVVMIAKLIAEVAKLIETGGMGGTFGIKNFNEKEPLQKKVKSFKKTYVCKLKPTTIETFLDPSAIKKEETYSMDALNKLVNDQYLPLEFKIEPINKHEINTSGPDANNCNHKWGSWFDKECSGVFFRASVPYKLTVSINEDDKFIPLEEDTSDKAKTADKLTSCLTPERSTRSLTILAPNNGPVFSVDVSRAALVTKKTDLTIADGMLTKIDVNKPSQLIAGLQIPLDIVKELASIPADILTLRIKQYQDEGSLTKAQVEQLSQEILKIKKEKELLETQQSN